MATITFLDNAKQTIESFYNDYVKDRSGYKYEIMIDHEKNQYKLYIDDNGLELLIDLQIKDDIIVIHENYTDYDFMPEFNEKGISTDKIKHAFMLESVIA